MCILANIDDGEAMEMKGELAKVKRQMGYTELGRKKETASRLASSMKYADCRAYQSLL